MKKFIPSEQTAKQIKALLAQPRTALEINPGVDGGTYFFRWVKIGDKVTGDSETPYIYECVSTTYNPVTQSWTDGTETTMRIVRADEQPIWMNRVTAQAWGYDDDDGNMWYVMDEGAYSGWVYPVAETNTYGAYTYTGHTATPATYTSFTTGSETINIRSTLYFKLSLTNYYFATLMGFNDDDVACWIVHVPGGVRYQTGDNGPLTMVSDVDFDSGTCELTVKYRDLHYIDGSLWKVSDEY